MCDMVKTAVRRKFTVLNSYIRKKIFWNQSLISHIKKPSNGEGNKSNSRVESEEGSNNHKAGGKELPHTQKKEKSMKQ